MTYSSLKYKFEHWVFQWKQDKDGDIAFVLCNRVAFIKYKEHTLVKWNGHKMQYAPKYINNL